MPGEGTKAMRSQLDQQWKGFAIDLNNLISTLMNQGYTDLQPVTDLAVRNQQLMTLSQELYGKIQPEGSYSVPALPQCNRERSMLMQGIAVDYASRSASCGGDARPIEELVSEFASKMAALEKRPEEHIAA
ncbi:hypothetical protein [Pseudomonas sp.]|uniref:hypothetical protein n=1 Tax=Pseudomonas sp. TaxID=306 RepID=UPI003BB4940B